MCPRGRSVHIRMISHDRKASCHNPSIAALVEQSLLNHIVSSAWKESLYYQVSQFIPTYLISIS